MVCPLGPAVILTARPPERLFHLVFESPWWKGLGAESEEKREPVSDIDTGVVVSLKVLDPDGRLEKRTKSRHVGTSALCQKRTYAVQQNLLMMFQRRLSCVGRLAATASFGASTILGSRIVKVEPRPAHIQVHACYEGDIFRVEVI